MPETTRIVVTNTTPIIALSVIGRLGLLEKLYRTVLMPPAVSNEINAGENRAAAMALENAPYIKIKELSDPQRVELLNDLDRGEAESIALALEMRDKQDTTDHLLIIDERLGRRHAKRLGLTITGTLGVLLKAKDEGHIPLLRPLIDEMIHRGIYLGDALVERVLEVAGE